MPIDQVIPTLSFSIYPTQKIDYAFLYPIFFLDIDF